MLLAGIDPYYADEESGIYVIHGDCRDVLPAIGSVETCITDPPYALTANKKGGTGSASLNVNSPAGRSRIGTGGGFMGKEWDATIPGVEYWRLILAALLPGAHLLAFGGTRTHHRLMCAIEDAGFELREMLMWLYGSGFPKSRNIAKDLDLVIPAAPGRRAISKRTMIPAETDQLSKWHVDQGFRQHQRSLDRVEKGEHVTTSSEPVTDAAKLWDGWGTGIKPAYEPIIVAMKPLDGTYAQNAQRHGVAGLNIDGSRVGDGKEHRSREGEASERAHYGDRGGTGFDHTPGPRGGDPKGRWPPNLLLCVEQNEYELRNDVTPTQLRNLAEWMDANTEL